VRTFVVYHRNTTDATVCFCRVERCAYLPLPPDAAERPYYAGTVGLEHMPTGGLYGFAGVLYGWFGRGFLLPEPPLFTYHLRFYAYRMRYVPAGSSG